MTYQGAASSSPAGARQIHLSCSMQTLTVFYTGPADHACYLALQAGDGEGSSIVPYSERLEGSTVFLPMPAQTLYAFARDRPFRRLRERLAWSAPSDDCPELSARRDQDGVHLQLSLTSLSARLLRVVVYSKDLGAANGWGNLVSSCDQDTLPGPGDREIGAFWEIDLASPQPAFTLRHRFHSQARERIYELFVRLFGNCNRTRKLNGTLAENGCGKFADISEIALEQIAGMGFTHVWLMGVIRHATTTAYPQAGLPSDATDLMKGLAGSPYAIKDYFDVAPDLAIDPVRRLAEFGDLVARIHARGLSVLIDFVGNHVSRAYASLRPGMDLGTWDDATRFFAADNHFFYLEAGDPGGGPPLRLPTYDRLQRAPVSPTCAVINDCSGLFAPESMVGRVTGNNAITWQPSLNDWYETVKLNYGFDFAARSNPVRQFPHAGSPDSPIPDTWTKMDAVLEHWQALGVDGFRCDMAHMLPPEFWRWSIGRARTRNPAVFFMAEAYNDSFTVETRAPEVLALRQSTLEHGLLHAGFNSVYGHETYRVIKGIYDGANWANDIDHVLGTGPVADHSVFYAENHDEIRLAFPHAWGGFGMRVGVPVSAILLLVGRGPVLFYNGQEVGEPAIEAEGFSRADGRTTLFDYWSMPELTKWVDEGAFETRTLSPEQQNLRSYYARLLTLSGTDVFRFGQRIALNPLNLDNPHYGRLPGETVSGHWIYSFLRYQSAAGTCLLVVVNLQGRQTFADLTIQLSEEILSAVSLSQARSIHIADSLSLEAEQASWDSASCSVLLRSMPPLSARVLALSSNA